jgi:biotin carboxylase
MEVSGAKTGIRPHLALLSESGFIHGDYTIKWLKKWLAKRTG